MMRTSISSLRPEEVQYIIRSYSEGRSNSSIADDLGTSRCLISYVTREVGKLPPRAAKKHTSLDVKSRVVELYLSGMSMQEVAIKVGVSGSTVSRMVKASNVPARDKRDYPFEKMSRARRRLGIRQDAFDCLTGDGIYWIGFLAGDGGIRKNGRSLVLTLSLSAKDEGHIRDFCTFIGYPADRARRHSRGGKEYVTVSFCTGPMGYRLMDLGIVPCKSKTATPPESSSMAPDYWRGVVDADGTVRVVPRTAGGGFACISLVGSRPMMDGFARFVKSIGAPTRASVNKHKSIWSFSITGPAACVVIQSLYGNCGQSLARKKQSADHILSNVIAGGIIPGDLPS